MALTLKGWTPWGAGSYGAGGVLALPGLPGIPGMPLVPTPAGTMRPIGTRTVRPAPLRGYGTALPAVAPVAPVDPRAPVRLPHRNLPGQAGAQIIPGVPTPPPPGRAADFTRDGVDYTWRGQKTSRGIPIMERVTPLVTPEMEKNRTGRGQQNAYTALENMRNAMNNGQFYADPERYMQSVRSLMPYMSGNPHFLGGNEWLRSQSNRDALTNLATAPQDNSVFSPEWAQFFNAIVNGYTNASY